MVKKLSAEYRKKALQELLTGVTISDHGGWPHSRQEKPGHLFPAFPLCGFESLMRVMGVVFELHNGIKIHLISTVKLRTALIGLMHLCY